MPIAAQPLRPPRWGKLAALAVVLALLVVAQRWGVLERFGEPARLAQTLVELGPYGFLAFIGAYTLLQPFGVPGTAFVFAAPLIWPWPTAFALSMVGTMTASVVGFSFARYVARDWVSTRLPPRFQRYEEALASRAFFTVFMLRLVLWMPQLLHAFLGVSKVRFWTHFWASLLGYLPNLLLVSYFGERIFDALAKAPLRVWVGMGVATLVVLALVPLAVSRYHSSRRRNEKSDS